MKELEELLAEIRRNASRPVPFEPGDARFWDDPYISARLLEAHLDPSNEAASRPPEAIDKEVRHLLASGAIRSGDRVLDLGCGPGLYASRLATEGVKVTGVDISENSLNYAIAQSKKSGLDINYRRMNFLEIEFEEEFDVVLQTNGELNTFSEDVRDDLLARIRRALRRGGRLIFDVTTRELRIKTGFGNHWEFAEGGLWRPGRHLVLEQGFDYPERDVFLNQYIIVDQSRVSTYRFWFHDYTLRSITEALRHAGFKIEQAWNDLAGTPYEEGGDWIALVAAR